MYMLSFGKWSRKAGRFLTWDRVYWRGYKWLPLCKLHKRYSLWFGYW